MHSKISIQAYDSAGSALEQRIFVDPQSNHLAILGKLPPGKQPDENLITPVQQRGQDKNRLIDPEESAAIKPEISGKKDRVKAGSELYIAICVRKRFKTSTRISDFESSMKYQQPRM